MTQDQKPSADDLAGRLEVPARHEIPARTLDARASWWEVEAKGETPGRRDHAQAVAENFREAARRLRNEPSAVEALREIREEVGKYSTTFGASHLQAANDLAALVVKIVTIASEASGEAWCPEHHIPCRWGCEMDCFLRDCTPEEVATARATLTRSTEEA